MMQEDTIYKQLSKERKRLQKEGELPDWVTTPSWQVLKSKYLDEDDPTLRSRFRTIAQKAAEKIDGKLPMPDFLGPDWAYLSWADAFFELFWEGYLAGSTPVLTSMGNNKGCSVSCSGSYVGDSVYDFYDNRKESAILSQKGFGTSGYLGDIRPRGSEITAGGVADGKLPVFKGHVQMARDISQGSTRRGSWAGYMPIDDPDFWEISSYVVNNPDDFNLGWCISNNFIYKMDEEDEDSTSRYQRSLKNKLVTGKGYYFFVDKVNEQNPPMYKDRGMEVKASNLCTEITLYCDEEHTFTCVLSSLNLAKYDEWKDRKAAFIATVFLDCVAQDFIDEGREIKGLEKAVRFTEKGRALGLGALGFHTYLQQNDISFESLDAHYKNAEIFKHIREEADEATKYMAEHLGEPEWCEGYGVRNTHLLAIAPNLSSALICGSVSQGIEPMYKNVYAQNTPAGEINRINPVLLKKIEEKGLDEEACVNEVLNNNGSVQDVDWLDEEEKKVLKTAFEIDQSVIIRLASVRQRHIDQAQSINLFFPADEDEEVISAVHKQAFKDPWIKSLYYIRSEAGVKGSTGECEACE